MTVLNLLKENSNFVIDKKVKYNISGNLWIEFIIARVRTQFIEYLNEEGEKSHYTQYLISDGSCAFYPVYNNEECIFV